MMWILDDRLLECLLGLPVLTRGDPFPAKGIETARLLGSGVGPAGSKSGEKKKENRYRGRKPHGTPRENIQTVFASIIYNIGGDRLENMSSYPHGVLDRE
jgi:hypothetical protein